MSYGTSAALGLAGLLWAAVALDPAPASPDVAVTHEPHLGRIVTQVDAARGRVWSLTGSGVTLHDRANGREITLPLPGWHWAGAPYGCPLTLPWARGARSSSRATFCPSCGASTPSRSP